MSTDLSKEREQACIPVAMTILRIIAAEENLYMGSTEQAPLDEFYKKLFTEKIEPVIRGADIKMADMGFIFQLVLQPIDNIKATSVSSINDAFDGAIALKLGIKDVADVRVSDIIRVQQEAAQLSTGNVASGNKGE